MRLTAELLAALGFERTTHEGERFVFWSSEDFPGEGRTIILEDPHPTDPDRRFDLDREDIVDVRALFMQAYKRGVERGKKDAEDALLKRMGLRGDE